MIFRIIAVTALLLTFPIFACAKTIPDKQQVTVNTDDAENYIEDSIFSKGAVRDFIVSRREAYCADCLELPCGTEITGITDGYGAYGYDFTYAEVRVMAQVMRHEAGNQCEAGQIAVVEVILNRLFSPYFPNTICGVVYQPDQFSYVEESVDIIPTKWETDLVLDVIWGNKKVLDDPTIMFYRNPEICIDIPACYEYDWDNLSYAGYIQDHAFYRNEFMLPSNWNRRIVKRYEDSYKDYFDVNENDKEYEEYICDEEES